MFASNLWSRAYRIFGDAAGAAFEKAFRRYREGKQGNPISWDWGLISYACNQSRVDQFRKIHSNKRGNGRVTSLDQKVPNAKDLTLEQVIPNGRQVGRSSSVKLSDPAKIVAAREKLKKLRDEPLQLVLLGYISQEEAAEMLGVSQSTVSRRLDSLRN